MNKQILADGRWLGTSGIGRVTQEILSRLPEADILLEGPKPLSFYNLIWQHTQLNKNYKLYYSPGFNPVLRSPIPYVLTIHDLIYLQAGFLKKSFFDYLVKPSIKQASAIITVSDYSKNQICDWSGIHSDKVHVIYNGISETFTDDGVFHRPHYPYFLYVGNAKPHKNLPRLIQAFANATIDPNYKLILVSDYTNELAILIKKYRLESRIVFNNGLNDKKLAEYYRGATALLMPSLYEGFGLPALEAMACGIPVLAANTSALPEITGNAALLCDPLRIDSITMGIEQLATDGISRLNLIKNGLTRSELFSWDIAASRVQSVLNSIY